MAMIDQRLAGNGQTTGSSGLVSTLIRIAEARGLIEVDRTANSKNPLIWPSRDTSAAPRSRSECVTLNGSTGEKPNDSPDQIQHRSRQFESLLKPAGMEPLTDARRALYDAIEEIVTADDHLTLDLLISRAKEQAKMSLEAAGKGNQPWSRAGSLVMRLLTTAAVLIGEEQRPIVAGWAGSLEKVTGLVESWRIKADAEIILALITLTDDVSVDDVSNLAGLLYRQRSDETRELVLKAVKHLLISDKAVEVVRGARRYLKPKTAEDDDPSIRIAS